MTTRTTNFPKANIISLNEINLEVFEAREKSSTKAIVLCHGFPEHAFSWRFQIPALVQAGYHVIVPNQRGYGASEAPLEIEKYDIKHLTGDLVALLDFYGYQKATFIGHDWGANVVWHLALLHPERVDKIINLALPYQERGKKPWLEVMENIFGKDFYFVHFNKQVGVADTILEENCANFLRHLFRKNAPPTPAIEGNHLINLALAKHAEGEAIMTESDLTFFIRAFKKSGFHGGINWYRNLNRNWHYMEGIKAQIQHPVLMIYGEKDSIPQSPTLADFAPNLTVKTLDCGHWIQQEMPNETNQIILNWLKKQ